MVSASALGILLTAVAICAQNDDSLECMPGLQGFVSQNYVTERCYQLVYKSLGNPKTEDDDLRYMNWADARQYCQTNAGRLVNIDSEDKQEFINSMLNDTSNPYRPIVDGYDVTDKSTWKWYNPDTGAIEPYDGRIWFGARMETDGTWRFDQYATSRSGGQLVITWQNWDADQPEDIDLRSEDDVCAYMMYHPKKRTVTIRGDSSGSYEVTDTSFLWNKETDCTTITSDKHPFICEYESYSYRDSPTSSWIYVIIVLAVFIIFGFLTCAAYCLWDKIHTSYNILQV